MTTRRYRIYIGGKSNGEKIISLCTLIENAAMGRQIGEAGRWEIDYGRFSINNRTLVLKEVFDEATH